ncbi:MAG: hypothetical protein HZA48_10410 [Planctomycetes bacterium]|nr:hypothetical protein [Planctomycetota bacterium]
MSVNELLDANRKFLDSGRINQLKFKPFSGWVVISCMSEKLADLLEESLGFERGEALFIRTAGAAFTKYDNSIERSVAIAIFKKDAVKIAVVGHSDCSSASDVFSITEAMKKHNIPRSAVPDDVREWMGLISNPEENVRQLVRTLRNSSVVPVSVEIHGFMLDTKTGKLTHIVSAMQEKELKKEDIHIAELEIKSPVAFKADRFEHSSDTTTANFSDTPPAIDISADRPKTAKYTQPKPAQYNPPPVPKPQPRYQPQDPVPLEPKPVQQAKPKISVEASDDPFQEMLDKLKRDRFKKS